MRVLRHSLLDRNYQSMLGEVPAYFGASNPWRFNAFIDTNEVRDRRADGACADMWPGHRAH
jgi:hypothetical protein